MKYHNILTNCNLDKFLKRESYIILYNMFFLLTNSRCLNSTYSVPASSYFDSVEEVIYSQGELYPEEPFDRSWDSDEDSKFNGKIISYHLDGYN